MDIMKLNEAKKLLKELGFQESTFSEFDKCYQKENFKFEQTAPFENNLRNLSKSLCGNVKKYYNTGKGSIPCYEIRAWTYNENE